jgi:hypothetical protein
VKQIQLELMNNGPTEAAFTVYEARQLLKWHTEAIQIFRRSSGGNSSVLISEIDTFN